MGRRTERRRALLVGLIWFHVLCPIALVASHTLDGPEFRAKSDAARFRALVRQPGRAYRDFEAEYPPGALLYFDALGPHSGFAPWVDRLVVTQALCDLLIAVALFVCAGVAALVRYLALSAPLLPFVLSKYDLLPAALAVVGVLIVGRRPKTGGVLLGLSVFTKIWTGALVLGTWARRQWSAAATAGLTLATGTLAWIWWSGGIAGLRQVLTFRGAKGWHAESGPGVVLELLTGDRLRMEAGSWRAGAPGAAATFAVALLLGAVVVQVWRLAARPSNRALSPGVAEAGATAAVLLLSPLLSPQFLIWLVPWVALAGARKERAVEACGVLAVALTLAVITVSAPKHVDAIAVQCILLARNAALCGVIVAACRRLASKPSAQGGGAQGTWGSRYARKALAEPARRTGRAARA